MRPACNLASDTVSIQRGLSGVSKKCLLKLTANLLRISEANVYIPLDLGTLKTVAELDCIGEGLGETFTVLYRNSDT